MPDGVNHASEKKFQVQIKNSHRKLLYLGFINYYVIQIGLLEFIPFIYHTLIKKNLKIIKTIYLLKPPMGGGPIDFGLSEVGAVGSIPIVDVA